MNNNKIKRFQIISTIIVFALGTLLHFTYNFSNQNKIVAIFSSVNESTWEHLKLIFFPMLITTVIGYFIIGKNINNYICAKTKGIVVAIVFTIIFFYTYTGILGKNIAFIDISSFFIAVILGEHVSYLLIINKFKCDNLITILILIVLFICFIIFTFLPPKIGLFKDPITNLYGIEKMS